MQGSTVVAMSVADSTNSESTIARTSRLCHRPFAQGPSTSRSLHKQQREDRRDRQQDPAGGLHRERDDALGARVRHEHRARPRRR